MNPFRFEFSPNAERRFAYFNKVLQKRILNKLEFFERSKNPLKFAKHLKGLGDIYRFRIGDYRILVKPKHNDAWIILLILKIGHRKEVYD